MEKPTDSFKETHNVVLAPRDTLFGGQVSRLQVAELVAACLTSQELSQNKTMEVIAETTAPFESFDFLLAEVCSGFACSPAECFVGHFFVHMYLDVPDCCHLESSLFGQ